MLSLRNQTHNLCIVSATLQLDLSSEYNTVKTINLHQNSFICQIVSQNIYFPLFIISKDYC